MGPQASMALCLSIRRWVIGTGDRGGTQLKVRTSTPLGMDGGHGGFEVTELLLLLAVKPALTTGLLWRFVVAAVLARYRWSLASVEHSLQHQVGWTTEAG